MKIAVEFDWELYHLLVVSPLGTVDEVTGLPLYEVMDGQHTGIGAITNGHIKEVWCWPGRPGETLESRAESFTKLNTQRTEVTPVELFWAAVSAQKEEALEVVEACRNTGASIVRRPKPYGDLKVGETICTEPLLKLARKGGRRYVQRVLQVCMNLRLSPIGQVWIMALESLLLNKNSPHFLEGLPDTVNLMIENAVGRIGVEDLMLKAKISHSSSASKDNHSLNWWLAYHIRNEVKRHAANK